MNRQPKKLQRIGKIIDLEWFYSIQLGTDTIVMHGDFTQEKFECLRKWFNFTMDDGMIRSEVRHGIKIILL